jgi:hypothetical protein
MIHIVQGDIRSFGFDWYDVFEIGRIQVDFAYFEQPDSSYKNVALTVEGEGKTTRIDDTVVCYLLKRGYFCRKGQLRRFRLFGVDGVVIQAPRKFRVYFDRIAASRGKGGSGGFLSGSCRPKLITFGYQN